MTRFRSLSTFLILIRAIKMFAQCAEGLEPLTTNNNLMDLAQLSGCAFCYLELKFGKEYVTMELTKSEQIRAGLQRAFRVAHQPRHRLSATATNSPYPVN